MKRAVNLLLLSACLIFAPSVAAETCPPTLKTPKPGHHYCGASLAPKPGKAATRSFIDSTLQPSQLDCVESCMGVSGRPCRTFTFNPNTGICNRYKSTPPHLVLEQSTDGTQYWNNQCYNPAYTTPQFQLQVVGGAFDGQYIYSYQDSSDLNPSHFQPNYGDLYSFTCDGQLHNDNVNQIVAQDDTPGFSFYILLFPDRSKDNTMDVTCSIGSDGETLNCSSFDGRLWFACSGDTSDFQNFYNGLYLASDAGHLQSGGAATCEQVNIRIVRVAPA